MITKQTLEQAVQAKVDSLNDASTTEEILATAMQVAAAKSDTMMKVASADDLPDIDDAGINDGMVVFIDNLNVPVVSVNKKWLGLDGRLLRRDGYIDSLWGWGLNTVGRLGDGTTTTQSSPVSVVGGFTDWCQVSAGNAHTAALRTNGTIWAWGCNSQGRLGEGTTVNQSSPVSVVGGFTDWCQVSAGNAHTAAVRTNGTLWTWGGNDYGVLGDGTSVNKSSPVSVVGGFTDWCQAGAGRNHTAAIRTNGTLWAWGDNCRGAMGTSSIPESVSSPISVVGGQCWKSVSGMSGFNSYAAFAIRNDNTLWSWGSNLNSSLGVDEIPLFKIASPISVLGGFSDWVQISGGNYTGSGIRSNGTLWTWGWNGDGQLGDGYYVTRSSPVSVLGGFTDWCQVSMGQRHTVAVRSNGTAWAWGQGNQGKLGNNSSYTWGSPVSVVGGFTDWCQASAGWSHSAAVRTNGTLWTWGSNFQGRLGTGDTISASSPVSVVGGFTDWCQVSAGLASTLAVRCNGTLWSWGYNGYGELGDGTVVESSSPVSVIGGFADWCQVSAGKFHISAVRTNGTLWTWGRNHKGQLGDGTTVDKSSPVSVVGGFTDWCSVSAHYYMTIAIRQNGSVWAWGNGGGGLGHGGVIQSRSPVSVISGFTDWCQVCAMYHNTSAVRCNGTLWTWGRNTNGQIGDGTTIDAPVPATPAGGFTDWCQTSTGYRIIAAVRTNGTLWTWGRNTNGQLGDNTAVDKSSPVSVVGGFTDWCQVGTGSFGMTAIRTNGSMWSWGINLQGRLGDGTIVQKSSPVSVVGGFNDWCQVSVGACHVLALRRKA